MKMEGLISIPLAIEAAKDMEREKQEEQSSKEIDESLSQKELSPNWKARKTHEKKLLNFFSNSCWRLFSPALKGKRDTK